MPSLLPKDFYLRPVEVVALELLGQHLHHGPVTLRISEVEAYGGPDDSASHCRHGRTARNASMWEDGGCAYIYVCYGIHAMLNIVTGAAGHGSAVLIRACEPVEGLDIIRQRRGLLDGPALLTGPGRVAQALAMDHSYNGHLLHEPGGLELREGGPVEGRLCGPRIGVPYAERGDREARLRFAIKDTPWVAERRRLVQV